jgi:hypothetical protein
MVLTTEIINQIDDLYKPSGSFTFNYLIPTIVIGVWLYNVIRLLIQIQLNASKADWSKNKCDAKYLFVSGLIQTEPGLGKVGSTRKNFKDCVLRVNQI